MLIFEQDFINAEDYLAVVAGMPTEEILRRCAASVRDFREKGLARYEKLATEAPLASFGGDMPSAAEVLHLKITLLSEILNKISADVPRLTPKDLGCTVDCVWLRLHAPLPAVPLNWLITVGAIEGGSGTNSLAGDDRNAQPPVYGWHALGTLWFDLLLSDGNERPEKLWSAWRDANAGDLPPDWTDSAAAEISTRCRGNSDAPLEMESIISRLVSLGIDIRRGAKNPDAGGFISEIDDCMASLKTATLGMLFQGGISRHAAPAVSEPDTGRDRKILGILMNIRDRWEREADRGDDIPATVVLGQDARLGRESDGRAMTKSASASQIETEVAAESDAADDIPETVVLKPGGAIPQNAADAAEDDGAIQPPGDRDGGPHEEDLPETMILKPGGKKVPSREYQASPNEGEQPPPKAPEDDLPETVVISRPVSGKGAGRITPAAPPPREPVEAPDVTEEDDLPETVVISRPGSRQGAGPPHPPPPSQPVEALDAADEDLPETVVIERPGSRQRVGQSVPAAPPQGQAGTAKFPDQDMPETLILGRGQQKPESDSDTEAAKPQALKKTGHEGSEEDDVLTETVIIRPDNNDTRGGHS